MSTKNMTIEERKVYLDQLMREHEGSKFEIGDSVNYHADFENYLRTAKVEDSLKAGSDKEGGLQEEKPVTLLGRPVYISTLMPEKASDSVAMAFGDFSYYWIGERGNMSVKRLNEKYADTGMVGFRVTHRVDGKLVLSEAVKTIKYK